LFPVKARWTKLGEKLMRYFMTNFPLKGGSDTGRKKIKHPPLPLEELTISNIYKIEKVYA